MKRWTVFSSMLQQLAVKTHSLEGLTSYILTFDQGSWGLFIFCLYYVCVCTNIWFYVTINCCPPFRKKHHHSYLIGFKLYLVCCLIMQSF